MQQRPRPGYGFVQPQFVQTVQPEAHELAQGHQLGVSQHQHQIFSYPPPSVVSPPPFRHQPLSPGPVLPFPTPHYNPPSHYHLPPPLSHSPPPGLVPLSPQNFPHAVGIFHGTHPLLHQSIHPASSGHHYNISQASYLGAPEGTYPLSHPPPVFAPMQSHPTFQAFPCELPHQHLHPSHGNRPGSQAIVRPIPMYRAPAPGFENIIRQGISHRRPSISANKEEFPRLVPLPAAYVAPSVSSDAPTQEPAASIVQESAPPVTSSADAEIGEGEESMSPADPMEGSSTTQQQTEEYRDFAKAFRDHRIKLGYNEVDVSQQIALRFGYLVSEGDIMQFEALSSDLSNVRKLQPVLQTWVCETAKAAGSTDEEIKEIATMSSILPPKRSRKPRTSVDPIARERLEAEYQCKQKPTQAEMGAIAESLGVEKSFVRTWFSNRRQREKKKERKRNAASSFRSSESTFTISSPTYDITVEVPAGSVEAILPSTADVYITQSSMEEPDQDS